MRKEGVFVTAFSRQFHVGGNFLVNGAGVFTGSGKASHKGYFFLTLPMLRRLMKLSGELGLEFGVKITNTFPVDVKAASFMFSIKVSIFSDWIPFKSYPTLILNWNPLHSRPCKNPDDFHTKSGNSHRTCRRGF